ncbi:hypothetical protein PC128_g22672 [Phytophthora cactorum]|nr:hypothetical protein PC128_g22672 [Phytophthora cactorum]KAG4042707.1 hypothetical protein PC123_g21800 [Phytophthora cactorum]
MYSDFAAALTEAGHLWNARRRFQARRRRTLPHSVSRATRGRKHDIINRFVDPPSAMPSVTTEVSVVHTLARRTPPTRLRTFWSRVTSDSAFGSDSSDD